MILRACIPQKNGKPPHPTRSAPIPIGLKNVRRCGGLRRATQFSINFAFSSAITSTGISTICSTMPGNAVVTAPAQNAESPNFDTSSPVQAKRAAPHTFSAPDSHRIEKCAAVRRFAQKNSVFDQFCLFQCHYQHRNQHDLQHDPRQRRRHGTRPKCGKPKF